MTVKRTMAKRTDTAKLAKGDGELLREEREELELLGEEFEAADRLAAPLLLLQWTEADEGERLLQRSASST
jgi:hypothetical protein